MKQKDSKTDNRERGVFTIVVALLLPVVLGMFGLGLDIGFDIVSLDIMSWRQFSGPLNRNVGKD